MKKILKDTLQSNGKWSRKSLTAFFAFHIAVVYEFLGLFLHFETKEYVFITLLTLVGATLGLTVWDKK